MSYTEACPGKLLINSLPKSGTHLLASAVEVLGYQEHFKSHHFLQKLLTSLGWSTPIFLNYREVNKALRAEKFIPQKTNAEQISIGALTPCYVPASTLQRWLKAISQSKYILGHIPWTPALNPILDALNYHHIFIIRHPCAVISSTIPFVLDTGKMPARHFLETDLAPMSVLQRVNFLLEGGYAAKAGVEIKSFAEVYRSMLSWDKDSSCLAIRFEDLVGEQGGGSLERQIDTVGRIALHLGVPLDDTIDAKLKEIYNPTARTFRIGKIDAWKQSMEGEIVQRIAEYCEPLCQEAGYSLE